LDRRQRFLDPACPSVSFSCDNFQTPRPKKFQQIHGCQAPFGRSLPRYDKLRSSGLTRTAFRISWCHAKLRKATSDPQQTGNLHIFTAVPHLSSAVYLHISVYTRHAGAVLAFIFPLYEKRPSRKDPIAPLSSPAMEPFSVLAILTFIKDVLEQVRALKDTIDQVNTIHQFL
jgi:hypothetical protein